MGGSRPPMENSILFFFNFDGLPYLVHQRVALADGVPAQTGAGVRGQVGAVLVSGAATLGGEGAADTKSSSTRSLSIA